LTWLSVKEAANLLGITDSAVKKAIAKSKYEYRHVKGIGRGGKVLQISLESLPANAQARYHGQAPKPKDILQYTGKQREEADYKARIVEDYWLSALPPEEFVVRFNAENPPEDAITKAKLFRWQRKYKEGGVAALIDQRGGSARGEDSIPEEAWDMFYNLYMTQQKRSIKLCYDVVSQNFSNIPSVSSFERKIRKVPYSALVLYREGEKAFNDRCLPSMERSKLAIESNSIWFSDHHTCDVFVKSADGKRIMRPWLTVFFDARSNKVVSHLLRDAAPNATAVKQCFRLGVEENGLPDEIYFDNGKDYRSKSFSKDYPQSLVNQIGINCIYATKYHGQAKTVERFFGTFESRFGKRFDTYTGKDAKERPECMRVSNSEILTIAPTLEEFQALLADYIREYNQTPSNGIDMNGKCPNEVYYENLKTKRVIRDLVALRLLCGNTTERTVHKNGVSLMNNNYYGSELAKHVGEKVYVIYDPADIDKVSVFDMENRALCIAYAKIRSAFRGTSEEDYIKATKEKKKARAAARLYRPTRNLGIHEIIARNQANEHDFSEPCSANAVEQLMPHAMQNAKTLKATDSLVSSRRIREEDSLTATLLEIYQKEA